jgi:hypothetical protein
VNEALVEVTVPEGPPVIAVSGAVASTVHVLDAGLASTLPAASFARTWNVWLLLPRPAYAFGDVQAANAVASSEHSNVEPVSVEVNEKLTEPDVVPDGPLEIVVSGATVSTVQLAEAGEGSTLFDVSIARTWNVWAPCPRLV